MTETKTLPNGSTATVIPTDNDWTVTAYRKPGALVSKLIAVSPNGKTGVHRDKVADADLLSTAVEMSGGPKPAAIPNDIMSQLSASIDATKAVA